MNLTRQQIVAYFQKRFDGQRINWGHAKVAVKCPLHDDSRPSATVFLDGNGGFNCSGCGSKGNLFQFEAMYSHCTVQEAEFNVAEITGAIPHVHDGWRTVASYDYRDAEGKVLFQKRRLEHETEGKRFVAYHPRGNGWEIGIDQKEGERTKRVLYNLPDVVTANVVCIAEGEKKADILNGLTLYPETPHLHVAATCNFDGAWKPGQAPKWLEEYNCRFTDKWVFIFEDNDGPGRTWSQFVAQSVYPYAAGVKIISLSGLEPQGDIADWMPNHTVEELRQEIKSAPRWHPVKQEKPSRFFISGAEFLSSEDEELQWWVDGVIQKGSNGLIVAYPGAGKSFVTEDLCICLALGIPWMGHKIPNPIKVGLCAREDNPSLTKWRLKYLLRGKRGDFNIFEKNLWLNTKQQTEELILNDEEQVQTLISGIRESGVELVFLDVFSKLHSINENKSEEMGPLVHTLNRIQSESGCAIGIVHHMNKAKDGNITQRTRGSSVLNGWAEWILGLELKDPESRSRVLTFEKIKAVEEGKPIEFVIDSESSPGIITIDRVTEEIKPAPSVKQDAKSRQAGDTIQ